MFVIKCVLYIGTGVRGATIRMAQFALVDVVEGVLVYYFFTHSDSELIEPNKVAKISLYASYLGWLAN